MRTKQPWRYSYTFSKNDLQEYLTQIKSGSFIGDFDFRREIILQSQENGLIKLPDGFIPGDAHCIPLAGITFIEQPKQEYQNKH